MFLYVYEDWNFIIGVKSNFAFCLLHSTCGGEQPSYRVFVGKPDGKRPLGGSQLRWEDIKLGIK